MADDPVFQHLNKLTREQIIDALQELENERQAFLTQYNVKRSALHAVMPFAEGDDDLPAETLQQINGRPLRERIVAVMTARPDHQWGTGEIFEALVEKDWAPPGEHARTQVTNRLRDLVKAREIEKLSDGTYRLRGAPA